MIYLLLFDTIKYLTSFPNQLETKEFSDHIVMIQILSGNALMNHKTMI